MFDLGQFEVGHDKALQIFLKQRLDCLTGMVMEQTVLLLISEDAVVMYPLHDEDVVIDIQPHVLVEIALALLENDIELA